jgi:hypothetical protein
MTIQARRLLAVLVTVVVATSLLAAGPSTAGPGRDGPLGATYDSCARPALVPGLTVAPAGPRSGLSARERAARDAAALARQLRVPARGQALAIAAVLSGDVAGPAAQRRFLVGLAKVKGWTNLPPSVAIHRVLGTPDPFEYEALWEPALRLLAKITPARGSIADAVSVGGRAPRRCLASPASRTGLPLPAGTSYKVRLLGPDPKDDRKDDRGDRGGKKGGRTATEVVVDPQQVTSFEAPCGTPVLAATPGTVELVGDDTAAGPWLMRVTGGDDQTTTEYRHVQNPQVQNGDTVVVGQQLAEVGDLGATDRCALGMLIRTRVGDGVKPVDAVPFLTSQLEPVQAPGPPEPRIIPDTSFRISTYNVKGHHLTTGRGGMGPGDVRVRAGLSKLERLGVTVTALNEFETPQANVFLGDGDWGVHRATPNNRFRNGNSSGNAVAWRTDTWNLVGTDEFTVPFKVTLHMPVVFLQHRETGAIISVIAIHNPASTSKNGNVQGARNLATSIERAWITDFQQAFPEIPTILAGDFNDRRNAFCAVTGNGVLAASAGGSVGGACRAPRHGPVDWIFGTTQLDFLGQGIDKSFLGRITDHPLVYADVAFAEHEAPDVTFPDGGTAAAGGG